MLSHSELVPLENRQLIDKVLHIANQMFVLKEINGWKEKGAIARMIDPCFTKVDYLTLDQIKIAQGFNYNYAMLTNFIENWGEKIYFDGAEFKQKK